MAAIFTIKIEKLKLIKNVGTLSAVVDEVHWLLEAKDEATDIIKKRLTITKLATAKEYGFIKYEDINENILIEWLKNSLRLIHQQEFARRNEPLSSKYVKDPFLFLKEELERIINKSVTSQQETEIVDWNSKK